VFAWSNAGINIHSLTVGRSLNSWTYEQWRNYLQITFKSWYLYSFSRFLFDFSAKRVPANQTPRMGMVGTCSEIFVCNSQPYLWKILLKLNQLHQKKKKLRLCIILVIKILRHKWNFRKAQTRIHVRDYAMLTNICESLTTKDQQHMDHGIYNIRG